MNITFISTGCYPVIAGTNIYDYYIQDELLKQGHNIQIISRSCKTHRIKETQEFTFTEPFQQYNYKGRDTTIISLNKYEQFLLYPVRKLRYYKQTHQLSVKLVNSVFTKKFLKYINPQTNIIHYTGNGFSLLGFSIYQTAKLKNIPLVVSPFIHPQKWGDSKLDIDLYNIVDAILVGTEYERNHLINLKINPNKIFVIGAGPTVELNGNKERFKQKHRINGNIVLFVGEKIERKGYKEVLKSTEIVWKKFKDTYFVFIGSDNEESKNVFKNYTNDKILNLGIVDETEKADAYSSCDIFCMPSSEESFGMAYLDAWQYKKPIIAGTAPALDELIENKVDGLIVEQNYENISNAIIKLLEDKSLRESLGNKGYYKLQEKYTWKKIGEKFEKSIKKLMIKNENTTH